MVRPQVCCRISIVMDCWCPILEVRNHLPLLFATMVFLLICRVVGFLTAGSRLELRCKPWCTIDSCTNQSGTRGQENLGSEAMTRKYSKHDKPTGSWVPPSTCGCCNRCLGLRFTHAHASTSSMLAHTWHLPLRVKTMPGCFENCSRSAWPNSFHNPT